MYIKKNKKQLILSLMVSKISVFPIQTQDYLDISLDIGRGENRRLNQGIVYLRYSINSGRNCIQKVSLCLYMHYDNSLLRKDSSVLLPALFMVLFASSHICVYI